MEETQEILRKMGFENPNLNVWKSDWFGVFILLKTATPEDLAKFIYSRGTNKIRDVMPSGVPYVSATNIPVIINNCNQ